MLEPEELYYHLPPAAAPERLWARIEAGLDRPGTPRRAAAAWRIAAGVILAAAAAGYIALHAMHGRSESGIEIAAIAEHRALAPHPERLDFRSSDPVQVRAWVTSHAGVKAELCARPALEILGARIVEDRGARVAAVHFRVSGEPATVLIGRGDAAPSREKRVMSRTVPDTRLKLVRWQARGQDYALVSGLQTRSERACSLCHASELG